MSAMHHLTRFDKLVIALVCADLLVILCPWQLAPYDDVLRGAYRLLLHSIWFGALIYALMRSRKSPMKWYSETLLIIGVIVGGIKWVLCLMFFGLPMQMVIAAQYISVENENHKVLWIHNHGFLSNHNSFARVIEFPGLPFRLETDFEGSDLNGLWRKYSWDSEAVYEGTARYSDGQIVEVIDP